MEVKCQKNLEGLLGGWSNQCLFGKLDYLIWNTYYLLVLMLSLMICHHYMETNVTPTGWKVLLVSKHLCHKVNGRMDHEITA